MKALRIIGVFALALMSNLVSGQSDSLYVMHGDSVVNAYPTTYVDSIIFYRPIDTNTVTDIDRNTYKTVTIGTQVWMAENLMVSRYNDGSSIANLTDNTLWSGAVYGAWSYYNNDYQYATDGRLYNWYAVSTGKLCPTGWHVPTHAEWTALTDYLAANGHSGAEGKALKATTGWDSNGYGTENGTDNYGFHALPGGGRDYDGNFGRIGQAGYWWSSSEYTYWFAWLRYMSNFDSFLISDYKLSGAADYGKIKKYGLSVRCLKN